VLSIPTPESVYNGNYASLPSNTLKPPVEGNRTVPVEINWLSAGQAPRYTIHFNARSQQTLSISQIAALHIDNSNCGSSMHVAFPDTQFEVVVGANQVGFYPIVTNSLEFWCWIDTTPLAQDKTIIQVLNFLPPPILFSTQPGGTSVGTVREVDTAAPLQGGPITDTGTVSLATPLTINFGGTAGATAAAALDNLSGASGATAGPLTRSGTGTWAVAAGLSSPISVANGGTGRTSLTANAVMVGNGTGAVTSSTITSDNGTTLSVTTNLVIGTPAPAIASPQQLMVNSAANPPQAFATVPELWLAEEGASNATDILLDNYSTGGAPLLIGRKARGTAAAPAAIQAGDILAGVQGIGRGATSYSAAARAQVMTQAVENWSDTAQGTTITLATTAPTTITTTNRATIGQGVVIGNPAPDPGQGALVLNQNAAPPPIAPASRNIAEWIAGNDTAAAPTTLMDAFGGGVPIISARTARGTAAAPTATQAGDLMLYIEATGRISASAYAVEQSGSINFTAVENFSATANGTAAALAVTRRGTTALVNVAQFDADLGVGIMGAQTNNNAVGGFVGEYVSQNNAGGTALPAQTGTAATNIAQISLTPGDWDVSGAVYLRVASGTAPSGSGGITTTSATLPIPTADNQTLVQVNNLSAVGDDTACPLIPARISIAVTTTVYLIGQLVGQAGTGFGRIRARRMR
jgi:hypothetical protein